MLFHNSFIFCADESALTPCADSSVHMSSRQISQMWMRELQLPSAYHHHGKLMKVNEFVKLRLLERCLMLDIQNTPHGEKKGDE